MCRDCESECPTQSFNADLGLSDPERCIECMRCVYICPDQVIRVDERMEAAYEDFKTHLHLTEAMMAAKMSKNTNSARLVSFFIVLPPKVKLQFWFHTCLGVPGPRQP